MAYPIIESKGCRGFLRYGRPRGGCRQPRYANSKGLSSMLADIDSRYSSVSGLNKIESFSRIWAGVQVIYDEKYPGSGIAYADLSSEKATIVVCLDHKGGICAPRLT